MIDVKLGLMESVKSFIDTELLPELRCWTEHPENREDIVRKYLCISGQGNGMPVELSNSAMRLKLVDEFLSQFNKVSSVSPQRIIINSNLIYLSNFRKVLPLDRRD